MHVDESKVTASLITSFRAEQSDEAQGKKIMAFVEAGDKAEKQAIDRYVSAGRILIEARGRVKNFRAFLRDHCAGLSPSRAYELMKIAQGKSERVCANAKERQRRHRARVRDVTDTEATPFPSGPAALSAFKQAVNLCFPQMHQTTRQQALVFANAWRDTSAPVPTHSVRELPKLPRPWELPFEDA